MTSPRMTTASCSSDGLHSAAASELLPLFLDQLFLRQLADGRLRQGVAEFQVCGHLVAAELVGQEGAQLLEREALARPVFSCTNALAASPR